MRTVLIFTITYTVALFVYGQTVESPLANLYTGINIGLFILFAVLPVSYTHLTLPTIYAV